MDQVTTTAEPADEARDAEVKPFPGRHEAEAPAPQPAEVTAAPPKKGGRKRLILGAAALVALAVAAKEGYYYWTTGQYLVSTDDAYLKADITAIAPKVQGYVKDIAVRENQKVKAGDLLMRLDDGDYVNALKTAESRVATQAVTIRRIAAQAEAAKASVAQAAAQKVSAEAGLKNARSKYTRIQALAKSSVAAQAAVDDASAALDQAQAAVAGATAAIAAAKANVSVLTAQEAEASSQLGSLKLAVDQAKRNLDRTVLRAPVDGTVANLAVHVGDLVSPGQKIAAVVPTDAIYLAANYKETQLPGITAGEKVDITIDALPGRHFTGTVASLAPATGAQFSLLPPQNATGNFTKVVQRVPVRIRLPKALLASGKLQAGLSAVVSVDSRTGR
jgi:membrane fusion protein (multidrug efflux system)